MVNSNGNIEFLMIYLPVRASNMINLRQGNKIYGPAGRIWPTGVKGFDVSLETIFNKLHPTAIFFPCASWQITKTSP